MILLIWAMWKSQIHRNGTWNDGEVSAGARGEGEMGKGLMGKFQFGELKKFQRPAVQPCKHTTLFNCKVLKTVKSFTLCVVFIKNHNSKTNKTSNKRGRSYGVAYFVLFRVSEIGVWQCPAATHNPSPCHFHLIPLRISLKQFLFKKSPCQLLYEAKSHLDPQADKQKGNLYLNPTWGYRSGTLSDTGRQKNPQPDGIRPRKVVRSRHTAGPSGREWLTF